MDLPGLANIDMGTGHATTIQIDALTGGRINLSAVTQISDAATNSARRTLVNADGVGSVIGLSKLVNFIDNSVWAASWHSTLKVLNGAAIQLGSQTSFKEVDIQFDSLSSLHAGLMRINAEASISGAGDLWAGIENYGRLTVSTASKELRIHGVYIQGAAGTLGLIIDGEVTSNAYSRISVDGDVSLAGTLEITRANGYVPDLFTDYAIIAAQTVAGASSSPARRLPRRSTMPTSARSSRRWTASTRSPSMVSVMTRRRTSFSLAADLLTCFGCKVGCASVCSSSIRRQKS